MNEKHSPTPWQHGNPDEERIYDSVGSAVIVDYVATQANLTFIVTACNSHAALVSQRDTYRQALENIKEQIPEERSNRRRLPIIAIIIGIIDDALEVAKERQ